MISILLLFSQVCIFHLVSSSKTNFQDATTSSPNIIFIMMDDLGRSDISAFGAEWDTPNLDGFVSDSLLLSHHYIGYVCSASRSQFLTGRYSFHNGYGTLNVFDVTRLGVIPKGTPTLAEYLKQYTNYNTYAIGKWQLGASVESSLATNRGFDYFWGYNGGMEKYFSKDRDGKVDFYENLEPLIDDYENNALWGYSTDQYIDKLIEVIDNHTSDKNTQNNPFFMYVGLQAVHSPFPRHTKKRQLTEYYTYCIENYGDKLNGYDDRDSVCEAMIGVDDGIGQFLDYLQNNQSDIWDNTLIIFTSDNGGDISEGSCNYPLRGGKNTFFEGGQRVLAVGLLSFLFGTFGFLVVWFLIDWFANVAQRVRGMILRSY